MAKKRSTGKLVQISLSTVVGLGIFFFGVAVGARIENNSYNKVASVNQQLPNKLNYSTVNEVYQLLKSQYDGQLTTSQLLDGLKTGLANATGDPHTEYFNPADAKTFNDQLSETFTGIGAALEVNSNNNIEVVAPIAGFPAAKAGLQSKDIIASIDGVSTDGMSGDTAVSKIRGPKGTVVKLDVIRGTQHLTFSITRDNIKVPSVDSSVLNGNIGYMKINQFTDDTATLSLQAAQKFKQAKVKGIILDLRGNPGGSVDAAISVTSLWVPGGKTILQEKRGSQVISTDYATGGDILNGIPTIVLINGGSASASEITSGALHDDGVAQLLGEKSYGKGSVQQVNNLPDGSILKVTIAKWYRPNGQNIDKVGITPDKVVTMSDSDAKNGLDPQKDAAVTILEAKST